MGHFDAKLLAPFSVRAPMASMINVRALEAIDRMMSQLAQVWEVPML